EILIPFALLLATIKVLCQLNMRNELVALMASGVPVKRLVRPFVIFALVCTLFIYSNYEWFIPLSMKRLSKIEDAHFAQKNKGQLKDNVHNLELSDRSVILYHSFNSTLNLFFDVYWIRSIDQFTKMKYLDISQEIPEGRFVEHLVRDDEGNLVVLNASERAS